MEEDRTRAEEGGDWLDLSFVPQWARRSPEANPYADGGGFREEARPRDRFRTGGDRRNERAGMRRPGPGPARRPDAQRPDRRPTRADRGPGHEREGRGRPAPQVAPAPVEVSFIPERSALRAVVRRIQGSKRAFPLLDLATFFLSRDAFYEVKIEMHRPGAGPADAHLFRCRLCGSVSLSRAGVAGHTVAEHAGDLLETEDIDEGPPSGQFVCVVRCRRGGHLIGPPNHHLYAERLTAVRREHFAGVSEEDFQAQLETVRDPEMIEAWKTAVQVRRVYRKKSAPEGPPMDFSAAQAWLEETAGSEQVQEVRKAILPAAIARRLNPAEGLLRAVSEAWSREQRFPRTLLMALRPALRHLGLHLFRAGEHAWFATAVIPSAVSADHAIEPVRLILEHLEAHPGAASGPMLDALRPGTESGDPVRVEMLRHLHWLVDKGHVIEFSDGALAAPRRSAAGSGGTGRG